MFKSVLLMTVLISSLVGAAHATSIDSSDTKALKIASVTVTEVAPVAPFLEQPQFTGELGDIIASIDGIIAIGTKIWKIVDAGRPVITTNVKNIVSVLPNIPGEVSPISLMSNWSAPKVSSFRVSFKNAYKQEVVGFTYSIYFQFNGNYKDHGKYLTNLKVQASQINTAWGFNFDAVSELIGIANVGTIADPVASATIQISYAVKGLINESRLAQSYYVDGTGHFQIIP
jgi:hypothetical protein